MGFIPVLTNCGGGRIEDQRIVFEEVLDNIIHRLPADSSQIFLVGSCESTATTLDFLSFYSDRLSGAGFVNPLAVSSHYFNKPSAHKLAVLYPHFDERTPNIVSRAFYNALLRVNANTHLSVCYKSSHYINPIDYFDPIFSFLLEK